MKTKKYTLEEAYKEIWKIKQNMGVVEYQNKELKQAFQNGYATALNDMQENFVKKCSMMASINVFN